MNDNDAGRKVTACEVAPSQPTSQALNSFRIHDDWRFDGPKEESSWCQICFWNGSWADLVRRSNRCCPVLHESALESSASSGNFCCAVLLALFRKYVPRGQSYHITVSSQGELLVFDKHSRRRPPWGRLSIVARCPPHLVQGLPPGMSSTSDNSFCPIETGSAKSLAWAKDRIATCFKDHRCQTFRSKTRLPTRLIAIPQDPMADGVKLHHSEGLPRDLKYVALSHCWGTKTPSCLTTKENLERQWDNIPWTAVPQTFRDAVLFTRNLGLDYLWIDSLCIVQRDEADWLEESARMFEYYSNAHVTLAAASSPDCDGGLFAQNPVDREDLLSISFGGRDYPLLVSETPSETVDFTDAATGLGGDVERKYPLLSRAWAFQERLVSPRVIYFTKSQLIWDCYSGCAFEEDDARDTEPRQRLYRGLKQDYLKLLHQPGTSLSSNRWNTVVYALNKFAFGGPKRASSVLARQRDGDAARPARIKVNPRRLGKDLRSSALEFSSFEWNHVLKAYSQLQLSDPRDRLPAIAAIAEQVLSREHDDPAAQYLCGLRKGALHLDLLWTPSPDGAAGPLRRPGPRAPYVAPSWSWASFPGRIADTGYYEAWGPSTIHLVEDALVFNESRRFSRVLGGHIAVKGPVVECTWHVSCASDSNTLGGPQILRVSPTYGYEDSLKFKQFEVEFVPDYADTCEDIEGMVHQGRVEVCLLQTWTSPIREISGALALYRDNTTGTYSRLGAKLRDGANGGDDMAWGLLDESIFRNAKPRVLKLV